MVGGGVVPEISVMISSIGMDIGRGLAGVSDVYEPPADFVGDLTMLRIETERAMRPDEELAAEIRTALGSQ